MKVSMNWLKDYVDIGNDYRLLQDKFNLMSQEVASLYQLVEIDNLVIGHVKTCVKHPEADKLSVTTVDVGDEILQIICGAPNVAAGQKVIVSKVGAVLPGNFKIKKSKIRGIESNGMICSLEELGIKDFDAKETGIYVLGEDAPIGGNPLVYLHLDDQVLELDLTANRSDLLSMEGVAYDTACMLDKEIKLKTHHYEKNSEENPIKVFTETKNCLAYYGQVIKNVQISESPYWLKSRLLAAGIRPINNVVDITNYVMMEYGQPLHAFDFDKLASDTILVREAKEGETLITLDEQERKLLTSDVVITDGNQPIALAGVMGGLSTEVDDKTTKLLLEAAYFDPISVRKTSKRLELKSESSTRFEKGVDPNKIKKAMDYATELFVQLANGQVVGDYTFFDITNNKPHEVELTMDKLNSVIGTELEVKEVEEILEKLRFKYHQRNHLFKIEVPTRRGNVFGYQDIIEEIVRIYGYDRIPVTIPKTPTFGYLSKTQMLRRVVRNYFVNVGFNETVTYSLVSPKQAVEFDQDHLTIVEIMNPLNKERNVMRHSLLPSLIDIVEYNRSRKINDLFLFEIGRSYREDGEIEHLSGLACGLHSQTLWQNKKEEVDFFFLKGVLEGLFNRLHIENIAIRKAEKPLPGMHPGMVADVFVGEKYLGYFGKLHPQKEYDLNLDKTYVFEFNFEVLGEAFIFDQVMEDIPKYPSVTRDIALVVDKDVIAQDIVNEVQIAGKKSLKEIEIFDLYEGVGIETGKKSLALSLTFTNPEKTLETKEVDTIIDRILKHLENVLSAKLR